MAKSSEFMFIYKEKWEKEDPGNCRLAGLISIPRKTVEHINQFVRT